MPQTMFRRVADNHTACGTVPSHADSVSSVCCSGAKQSGMRVVSTCLASIAMRMQRRIAGSGSTRVRDSVGRGVCEWGFHTMFASAMLVTQGTGGMY